MCFQSQNQPLKKFVGVLEKLLECVLTSFHVMVIHSYEKEVHIFWMHVSKFSL